MDTWQILNGVLLVLYTQEPRANLINNKQYGRESSNIALSIHFCKPLRLPVGLHVINRIVFFMLLLLLPGVLVAVTVGGRLTVVLTQTWLSAGSHKFISHLGQRSQYSDNATN